MSDASGLGSAAGPDAGDVLDGGAGDDRLAGGAGSDTLTGTGRVFSLEVPYETATGVRGCRRIGIGVTLSARDTAGRLSSTRSPYSLKNLAEACNEPRLPFMKRGGAVW